MSRLALADGWEIQVDRGPDWLFVKLIPPANPFEDKGDLAEQIWGVLELQFVYRVVLEFDDVPLLHSQLIGALVRLSRRIESQGGLLRICGLSADNLQALRSTRVTRLIPYYANRADAVMGHQYPMQPR